VNYFNIGLCHNTIELFGRNPLLALWPAPLPADPSRGDGVSWKLNALYARNHPTAPLSDTAVSSTSSPAKPKHE
jgi:hypothetical protein